MKPSELAKYRFSGELPSPVELSGTLVASGDFSHLIDDAEFSADPCFGVLLPGGLINRLSHLEIPLLGGSSVNFMGQSTFVCEVKPTGYRMLPYRMTKVYEFTFEDEYVGKHSFQVSNRVYEVYITPPKDVDARILKGLQSHFEQKFPIMELRRLLSGCDQVLLHTSLEGKQLIDVEQRLKNLGIRYKLRHVPYRYDWLYDDNESSE